MHFAAYLVVNFKSFLTVSNLREFVPSSSSFSPEQVDALGKAYDMALLALHDVGQPDIVHEVIAKRIIEAAQKGERDPAALCAVALAAFNDEKLIR